ncbi:MAG: phosphodiesterase [Planctomycetota bacterium]|nr:MAG: phosphodiesterase [Planctomycetota bacterium]
MIIGVLSDIHDNLANLRSALRILQNGGAAELVFCGDFCSPIPARELASFAGPIHCVLGNGDGDPLTIAGFANHTHLKLYGPYADIEVGGSRIAITHYPIYGQALARTGDYAAVFSGHTHEYRQEQFGNCVWLNPGEVMGWKGRPTCATYDTSSRLVQRLEIL